MVKPNMLSLSIIIEGISIGAQYTPSEPEGRGSGITNMCFWHSCLAPKAISRLLNECDGSQ
jgi:hypothetical protein